MSEQKTFNNPAVFRLYLLGFRWFSLLLGFLLINFQINSAGNLNPIPQLFQQHPEYLFIALLFYQVGASLFAYRGVESRFSIYILLIGDIGVGGLLSYYFGIPFLLLAMGLPAIEAALFMGLNALILTIIVICTFYLMLAGSQLIKQLGDPAQLQYLLSLLKTQGMLLFLILWLFWLALKRESDGLGYLKRLGDEKLLLFEELENTKREFKEVFGEISNREQAIIQLKNEAQKLKEDLEETYKKLHETRLSSQAAEQAMRVREAELVEKLQNETKLLESRKNAYEKLTQALKKLSRTISVDDVAISVVDEMIKMMPAQTCILFLIEENKEGKVLFAEVAASPYLDYFKNFSLGIGEGAPGWVVYSREPLKIDDGAVQIDGDALSTLLTYEKSALIVPVIYEEEVLGVLYLGQPKPNSFNDLDLEQAVRYSGLCANVLHNIGLFQKMVGEGFVDKATGLYNALYFNERFSEEIRRARRYSYFISLTLLKVDNLAALIEQYGREFEENLYKQVGELIQTNTRDSDVSARLTEDTFAILNLQAEAAQAALSADRLRMAATVREIYTTDMEKVNITLSCGISAYPAKAQDKYELYQNAMEALDKALASGGNNTTVI